MKINCKLNERGLTLKLKNKKFSLIYPKKIWQKYPRKVKNVLVDNLVHLLTINLPLVAGIKKLEYNTSFPLFKPFFDTVIINSLPHSTEDYYTITSDIIKKFLNIEYKFKDLKVKIGSCNDNIKERAITILSCGKDSLLSLAVCNEIGLNPISIYVNDTILPKENKLKIKTGKKISKEFNLKFFVVKNEIEKLNDFEFWDKEESVLGYNHMVTGFCFIALPFAHYFKSKYIVVGNQQDMNFSFINKDGFLTYPAFDQTRIWMKQQDLMMKLMTSGKVDVISVIEPLTNIAITRILHKRYNEFGKYEVSCDILNTTSEKRWCHNCSKCARLSIFMKANGIDTKIIGFKNNLLNKEDKKLYCLFNGNEVDCYEKSREARDQQLLAFYMAYKNKERGYLIDLFKKKFLEEAKSKEDYLFKKFFSIHESVTIPNKMKNKIFSIFREELKNI